MNLPDLLKQPLRPFVRALRGGIADIRLARTLQRLQWVEPTPQQPLQVSYAHSGFPRPLPGEHVVLRGGGVKYRSLDRWQPHAGLACNILYAVSSRHCASAIAILQAAQARGIKVVWNQNGVGYPAWAGAEWRKTNATMQAMLHAADYVLYQSHFCKMSADHFLGVRWGAWEIVYNAVDTNTFTPAPADPDPHHLVLLSAGSINAWYRFERAARTVAAVARMQPAVRWIVAGQPGWHHDAATMQAQAHQLLAALGISERVTMLGAYTQVDAPALYRRAHILLHTKYNDPCPSVVLEAMASGLPVVYSQSGGVHELVGNDAGIGIAAPLSWDEVFPPDPEPLAAAVLAIAAERGRYASAARQRAVQSFDLEPWLQRHRDIFTALIYQ